MSIETKELYAGLHPNPGQCVVTLLTLLPTISLLGYSFQYPSLSLGCTSLPTLGLCTTGRNASPAPAGRGRDIASHLRRDTVGHLHGLLASPTDNALHALPVLSDTGHCLGATG